MPIASTRSIPSARLVQDEVFEQFMQAHGRVQPDRLFDYFVAYMDLNYACGPIPRRLFDRLRARYERRAG